MIAVRVQYKVDPDYVETNRKNIKAVMDELEKNPIEGMWYKAFLLEDGQSFMHINISKDQITMDKLNNVDLFKKFRIELKESGPLSTPRSEDLNLISDSF